MKRKFIFAAAAALSMMVLGACDKKNPDPGPNPPEPPGPTSEITTDNVTPGGFSDDGLSPWDE